MPWIKKVEKHCSRLKLQLWTKTDKETHTFINTNISNDSNELASISNNDQNKFRWEKNLIQKIEIKEKESLVEKKFFPLLFSPLLAAISDSFVSLFPRVINKTEQKSIVYIQSRHTHLSLSLSFCFLLFYQNIVKQEMDR